jgi:glycosyltransferase involved in cell wall biosynthesis
VKIFQFIYELVPGGAERFVVDLTNELVKEHEVYLYTLRDDSIDNKGFYVPEISGEARYINLKIRPGFNPVLIWRFYRILRKEMPDVVHCHLNLVNYFFLLSIFFKNRIRFIYTIHNAAETEVESEKERILRRFFFKYRFFVPVAISDETKVSYQTYYKLNDVPVIYNGRKFSGRSQEFDQVVAEIDMLKPSPDSLVFCHVSRFDEIQKNHTMLIKVFNRLKTENFNTVLLVIGEGFENAISLRELANDNIHFLGIKSNVNDYLYCSDAFCLSSNFEGMPISLIEALACGCTPICTPVGGIVNTIQNGVTGFLSKSLSEDDYLEAIKEFIADSDSIDKSKLIKYCHDNFDMARCTENYQLLFEGKALI